MVVTDQEIDRIARRTLARHGPRAAIAAAERLNACIDRSDWGGRDTWARIVRRVHEYQRADPDAQGCGMSARASSRVAAPAKRRPDASAERAIRPDRVMR